MTHSLEEEFGLTADELLDAMNRRFRARVTLEGAVAEVHLGKQIKALHMVELLPDFRNTIRMDIPITLSGSHHRLIESFESNARTSVIQRKPIKRRGKSSHTKWRHKKRERRKATLVVDTMDSNNLKSLQSVLGRKRIIGSNSCSFRAKTSLVTRNMGIRWQSCTPYLCRPPLWALRGIILLKG